MIPWDKPYSDEIVPNVRPVDIKSVVYIASFCGDPNSFVPSDKADDFVKQQLDDMKKTMAK